MYYFISSNNLNKDYDYFLILDSTFKIKTGRFSKSISKVDCFRTFTSFVKNYISETSEKPNLYFYPQNAFIDKNTVEWIKLFDSFKKLDFLTIETTPSLDLILKRINKAYHLTLTQGIHSIDSLKENQKTKNLKDYFFNTYETFRTLPDIDKNKLLFYNREKILVSNLIRDALNTEELTSEVFLQKIYFLNTLLESTLNLSTAKRKMFQKILLDSEKQVSLFENFEPNKMYLTSFFTNLLNLEKILKNNNSSALIYETKDVISFDQFFRIMHLAGNSLFNLNQRTFPFERLRLRIIYFLLYISGLKAKDLVSLDYQTIKDLLEKKEGKIELIRKDKTTKFLIVILKDFNKDFFADLEIEKDLESFFMEENFKFLGSSLSKKSGLKDLVHYLKVINNDLDFICQSQNWKKLTTHHFRHTFIHNILKTKSFSEIEHDYPYLNKINKKTYL